MKVKTEYFTNKPCICLLSLCVVQDSTRFGGIDEPWQHSECSLKKKNNTTGKNTVGHFALCLLHLLTRLVLYYSQCFMNSILQCLSNTQELRDYCLMNFHRTDLNNNSTASTALMEGECSINLKFPLRFKSAQNTHSGAK